MNKNIEVINDNLWAVKFSLIPYIPGIDYKPDTTIPAFMEPCRLAEDGLLLLNKEHQNYSLLKDSFQKLAKKNYTWLKKEVKRGSRIRSKNEVQTFYYNMIHIELERREKLKRKR
ncbi:hypothetical protein [Cytobacillus praedii]|uniref:hypothetical protein n=1 Tax=Cytobacillus praedii TaxID=1742358 RepID=UPI002E1C4632|nr:hypothetical protein [Cytobacillus praedii]